MVHVNNIYFYINDEEIENAGREDKCSLNFSFPLRTVEVVLLYTRYMSVWVSLGYNIRIIRQVAKQLTELTTS